MAKLQHLNAVVANFLYHVCFYNIMAPIFSAFTANKCIAIYIYMEEKNPANVIDSSWNSSVF